VTDEGRPRRDPGANAKELHRVRIPYFRFRPLVSEGRNRSAATLRRKERLGHSLVPPTNPHACDLGA
jgi:hypothetical protein